jgi:nicotinamidase-related amidase
MSVPRLDRSQLGVLVIDVQPYFVESAFADGAGEYEALMVRLEHLFMIAEALGLPLIATFEKPIEENGELPGNLERLFPEHGERYVKNHFGLMSEPEIRAAVERSRVAQWVVAGAETDVCVMQSTLGLLDAGYEVFLLEDCLFTTEADPAPALERIYGAGAIPLSLKSMLYELIGCVDNIGWDDEILGPGDGRAPDPFPPAFIAPELWPARAPRAQTGRLRRLPHE